MKQKLFISYSNIDIGKVELIRQLLLENQLFEPVIIASNREALKPLADKVSEGIINSAVVIPILTKGSYNTQWINQEIGFATALRKKVMPVIEIDIIDILKGFIHKQIDLPYSFAGSDNLNTETESFASCFKNLLNDLENQEAFSFISPKRKVKTKFELLQERLDAEREEKEFQEQRKKFRLSKEGVHVALEMMNDLVEEIKNKIKILETKNILIASEESPNPKAISLKYNRHSITIACDFAEGLTLYIGRWKGLKTLDNNAIYYPGDEPRRLRFEKFNLDKDIDGNTSWVDLTKDQNFTSQELVDESLDWLLSN